MVVVRRSSNSPNARGRLAMLNVLFLSATEQRPGMPTLTCGQLHRGIKVRRCCVCSAAVSRVHEGSTLTGSAAIVLSADNEGGHSDRADHSAFQSTDDAYRESAIPGKNPQPT